MTPSASPFSRSRQAIGVGLACLALATSVAAHGPLAASAGAVRSGQFGTTLGVRLSAGDAPGTVIFELSNRGTGSVSVLHRDTPLAPTLSADVFDIRDARAPARGAVRASYLGRLYKRPAPTSEDFVAIGAGESLSAVIDLGRYYDVPAAGDYRVGYRGNIDHAASPGRRSLGTAHLHAEGPIIPLEPSLVALRARPPRFNGCSVEQQNTLVEATAAAEGITSEALSSLTGLAEERRGASPRYRQWFGDYTAARYDAVTDNYAALLGALSGETLAYDCTCNENAFAFVFPSAPYDIYMCPVFFRANLLGTDSQAGTIVHELSHFTILAGTRDFEYGHRLVAALAAVDPDRAIGNADSYEYFAENTPALAMSGDLPGGAPNEEGSPSTLPLDTLGSAFLATGETATFVVTGAEAVTLDSVTGDADLFVFTSPSLDDDSLVCSSTNGAGTLDVCAMPDEGTYYVSILAYSNTSFEVVARGRDERSPAQPDQPVNDGAFSLAGGSGGGSGGVGWLWLLAGGLATLRRAALHGRRPRDSAAVRIFATRRSAS